ncbi:MAG: PhnD/SsuA/transferrin family substrate-binding protein [Streptosporangiales bacterium]|nr:PhnD/SsuA/transferrin family substrate-binding protein [Streptosporangiales bacterium]
MTEMPSIWRVRPLLAAVLGSRPVVPTGRCPRHGMRGEIRTPWSKEFPVRQARARLGAAIGLVTALMLTGCSSLTGPDDSGTSDLVTLRVGAMPIPDAAAVYIANERGYFHEEGLEVRPEIIQGGAVGLPRVASGSLDVVFSNYVSALSAHAAGKPKLRMVGDAFQTRLDTFPLMVMPDSPLQDMSDLKGKTIAVNTKNNVGTLTVTSALQTVGVDVERDKVQFVEVPFPEMTKALKDGDVDVAWLNEPFLTDGQRKLGLRKVGETMDGPTAAFPISGFFMTQRYAQEKPQVAAAFQRAIERAQRLASEDRRVVEQVLPSYAKIDPQTAAIITLGDYPSTVSRARVQRVADLMLEHGYLKQKLDVRTMLPSTQAAPAD